jgi:hypothetical protein
MKEKIKTSKTEKAVGVEQRVINFLAKGENNDKPNLHYKKYLQNN